MNIEEFKESTGQDTPPSDISENLVALWYDAKGDWDRAHEIAQSTGGHNGDWIHAYLHRKEGDQWNASYWYSRVGKTKPDYSLDQEWEELAKHLLS